VTGKAFLKHIEYPGKQGGPGAILVLEDDWDGTVFRLHVPKAEARELQEAIEANSEYVEDDPKVIVTVSLVEIEGS
jgi:hypothetical protein